MENKEEMTNSKSEYQVELGKRLVELREKYGMSQSDVCEKFRISQSSLEKLELGESDPKKSDYYKRLYVMRFLKRMNEDNADNLALLDKAYEKDNSVKYMADTTKLSYTQPSKREKKKRNIKLQLIYLISFLFLIGVIGTSVYYTYNLVKDSKQKATTNETTLMDSTTLTPEKTVKAKVEPKKETETKVKRDSYAGTSAKYTISSLPDKSSYKLHLEFTGDSYISISDASNKSLATSTVYKKGDKVDVTVKSSSVTIVAGAASKVKASVNGETLNTDGFPADLVNMTIKNSAK